MSLEAIDDTGLVCFTRTLSFLGFLIFSASRALGGGSLGGRGGGRGGWGGGAGTGGTGGSAGT